MFNELTGHQSSIKKWIILRQTVQSMFSEQKVRPIKNGHNVKHIQITCFFPCFGSVQWVALVCRVWIACCASWWCVSCRTSSACSRGRFWRTRTGWSTSASSHALSTPCRALSVSALFLLPHRFLQKDVGAVIQIIYFLSRIKNISKLSSGNTGNLNYSHE